MNLTVRPIPVRALRSRFLSGLRGVVSAWAVKARGTKFPRAEACLTEDGWVGLDWAGVITRLPVPCGITPESAIRLMVADMYGVS